MEKTRKQAMKTTILATLLLLATLTYGQQSYTADNGMIFTVGEDIKLGQGSNSNKDFIFVYIESILAGERIYLGSSWSGYNFKIKKIKKIGNTKRGYKTYLILGGGNIANYHMDIESAIRAGEVYVPGEYMNFNN